MRPNCSVVSFMERISPIDQLGVGVTKSKFTDNIAAIRLLQQLQQSGVESVSLEEKRFLSAMLDGEACRKLLIRTTKNRLRNTSNCNRCFRLMNSSKLAAPLRMPTFPLKRVFRECIRACPLWDEVTSEIYVFWSLRLVSAILWGFALKTSTRSSWPLSLILPQPPAQNIYIRKHG
jgi:hypothetical protein